MINFEKKLAISEGQKKVIEQNLLPHQKRFKKGVSGNPKGKPKGAKSVRTIMRELAESNVDYKKLNGKKTTMKVKEAIITALMGKAVYKADIQAIKILIEQLEGLPDQKTILAGDPNNPLLVANVQLSVNEYKLLRNEILEEF